MPRSVRHMFKRTRSAAQTDAAFETPDPDATAAFYERVFGARVVNRGADDPRRP